MLYYLSSLFDFNLFQYISVRAGFAFFVALFVTLFAMPRFIAWAQRTSSHQPINDYAPEAHQAKGSTPTMGGIVFIGATLIASLLSMQFLDAFSIIGLFILLSFSWIGFKDDYAKIAKNENSAGLSAREKLIYQITFSLIGALALCFLADFNTELYIPFLKKIHSLKWVISLYFFGFLFLLQLLMQSTLLMD